MLLPYDLGAVRVCRNVAFQCFPDLGEVEGLQKIALKQTFDLSE